MTKGKCDLGTDRALRTFRIRELLDELPDPEVGNLETAIRLTEEALINLEFLLRDRTANLRVTTPIIPDRVGTSIANTNPDYASSDKFPLGYPIGVNLFYKGEREPTLEEKLILGRQAQLMLESLVQIRMSIKEHRRPEHGISLVQGFEESSLMAKNLLQAVNESEMGSPIGIRSASQRRFPGKPQACSLCRSIFCHGCPGLSIETDYWERLIDSRLTALKRLRQAERRIGKSLLPWMREAVKQLKSNKMYRWYHRITHER